MAELTVDEYGKGNINRRTEIRQPAWEDLERAITSLDGGKRSSLAFSTDNGAVLAVGGGNGQYHVSITLPSGDTPVVVTDTQDASECTIIIGGVRTPLPARMIVRLPAALEAARFFYHNGGQSPNVSWENG